jgi:hypothetical protein
VAVSRSLQTASNGTSLYCRTGWMVAIGIHTLAEWHAALAQHYSRGAGRKQYVLDAFKEVMCSPFLQYMHQCSQQRPRTHIGHSSIACPYLGCTRECRVCKRVQGPACLPYPCICPPTSPEGADSALIKERTTMGPSSAKQTVITQLSLLLRRRNP